MICLDNSVLSRFASPDPSPAVDSYLAEHATVPWTVPATVAFEFYAHYDSAGAVRRQQQELTERFDGILPFTGDVAATAAQVQIALDVQGVSLSIADLFHAAAAREAGATFVTRDAGDFDAEPVRDVLDVDIIRP